MRLLFIVDAKTRKVIFTDADIRDEETYMLSRRRAAVNLDVYPPTVLHGFKSISQGVPRDILQHLNPLPRNNIHPRLENLGETPPRPHFNNP